MYFSLIHVQFKFLQGQIDNWFSEADLWNEKSRLLILRRNLSNQM